MFRYAVLNSQDIVIGESTLSGPIESPDHIALGMDSEVKPGDVYHRAAGEFSRPEQTPTTVPKISQANLGRRITANAFWGRFSFLESVLFESALALSAELRVLDKRLAAVVATFVDLDDPMYATVAMPALVAANILSAERATAILSAPVQWKELPASIQQSFIEAGYQLDVV